jgi:hypothetical protein
MLFRLWVDSDSLIHMRGEPEHLEAFIDNILTFNDPIHGVLLVSVE